MMKQALSKGKMNEYRELRVFTAQQFSGTKYWNLFMNNDFECVTCRNNFPLEFRCFFDDPEWQPVDFKPIQNRCPQCYVENGDELSEYEE